MSKEPENRQKLNPLTVSKEAAPKPKILIAAGGSGGHLFPARQLMAQLKDCDVLVAGHGLTDSPFFQSKVAFQEILAGAPKRGKIFRFLVSTLKGFWQSLRLLYRFSPDVVVGFGSYHTFPIILAASVFRKKIVLFEANTVLGKVNRLFAPMATQVAIQFPLSQALKNQVFVRMLPWEEKREVSREDALAYFGFKASFPTILVFGGSQGASFFNEIMPKVLSDFPELQVIHLTGRGGYAQYREGNVCVKEFEHRMDLAYAVADIVVCRSGAGTIAELIGNRKPSLLIPFPLASDQHQWKNACFLTHVVKGSRLLEQSEASIERIRGEISCLFEEKDTREAALGMWSVNAPRVSFRDRIFQGMMRG